MRAGRAFEHTTGKRLAHILCMTGGLRGLLNASFELVRRLEEAGHRVTYACPHDVGDAVRAQGLRYVQLRPVSFSPAPPAPRRTGPLGRVRSRVEAWLSAPRRREEGLAELGMEEFRAFLDDLAPELVLIDAELYEHIFTVHDAGIPMALITPFFSTWKRPGLPPLQLDVTPGVGFAGSRLGLELVWTKLRVTRWLTIKRIALRYAFTDRRSVLGLYARRASFPRRWLEETGWVTLFNIHGLPALSLTARELDFDHLPRPGLHYVGPMVATERTETSVDEASAARLRSILAARDAPLLYCWLTTMDRSDDRFLRRVVDAVAAHPEWVMIVGYSGGAAARLPSLPPHIHAFDYVPQLEVLREADLCITNGGMNTINECVVLEVPMLIYPTGFADKDGCAARLAHRGLAAKGDIERDDPAAIAKRIGAVLADREIPERLAAMRACVERYRTARVLEDVVDSLIRSRCDGSPAAEADPVDA